MDNDLNIITVAIADDHYMVREGLRTLLEQETDIRVVGEAGNGREAVALVTGSQPDVIVMDVSMPEMNGIEVLKVLKEKNPDLEVILLTGHATVAKGVQAMKLGAADVLEKPVDIRVLTEMIKKIPQQQASSPSSGEKRAGTSPPVEGASGFIQGIRNLFKKS